MQERRLNKSGNTSFTVSLPIEWVRANGLTNQDSVYLSQDADTITVRCRPKPLDARATPTLDATGMSRRRLIEAVRQQYNTGAQEIRLRYATAAELNSITTTMERFPGFELHAQERNLVVYRDLFDQNLISEHELLRKMHGIIKTVLGEVLTALRNYGSHPDIATPRKYVDLLRKNSRLLERHIMRTRQITNEKFTVFLIGRSLLKIGVFVLDLLEVIAVLDERQVTAHIAPNTERLRDLYALVTRTHLESGNAEKGNLKEELLDESERISGEIMRSNDVLLAIALTALKNAVHELVRISEIGGAPATEA